MEINRTANKTIFLKESLDYYREYILDIELGIWKNSIEKNDTVHTKNNVSTQDIEYLENSFISYLKYPKNPYKRGQLIGILCRILDPKEHTLVYKNKKLRITWHSLIFKKDFPLRVIAGAVIGFFCKEFQVTNREPK